MDYEYSKYNNYYDPILGQSILNIVELKDSIEIVNSHFDFNTGKIKINIMIAIYLFGHYTDRYSLTESIFIHYKNIQEYFKKYAIFTFIIIGSEGDLSKNLVLKYFDEKSYVEFDQSMYNDLLPMLNNKINYGMKYSFNETDADILLWAGSNDYICFNFFKQLLEFYVPDQLQIYGIDNYFNGNNAVYYCKYRNHSINDIPFYWHNGKFNYANRENYNYCGGILGISRILFHIYPDLLETWNCDEGINETEILKKNNYLHMEEHTIYKLNTKNLFFINFKLDNGQDLSSFDSLFIEMYLDRIDNNGNYLNENFKKISQEEYKYFKKIVYDNKKELINYKINNLNENNTFVLLPTNYIPLNNKSNDLLNNYFSKYYQIKYLDYNGIIDFINSNNTVDIKIIFYFYESCNLDALDELHNLFISIVNFIKNKNDLLSKIFIFTFDFWYRNITYDNFLRNIFTASNYKVITSAFDLNQINNCHGLNYENYSHNIIYNNIWTCYDSSFCELNNNPINQLLVSGNVFNAYPLRVEILKYNNVIQHTYNYTDLHDNKNNYNLELNKYTACFNSSIYTHLHVILLKTFEILASGSLLVMPYVEKIYLEKIGLYNMHNCYLIDFDGDVQQQINNIFLYIDQTNMIRLNGYNHAKENFTTLEKFLEIYEIINK